MKIDVVVSKSDLGLHVNAWGLKTFAFYQLLQSAQGRLGHRSHVHLGQNVFMFLRVIRVYKNYKGFKSVFKFLKVIEGLWKVMGF